METQREHLPTMPATALCVCGRAVYFVRPRDVGERGHFHCRRCGRRYRMTLEPWTPGPSDGASLA